MKTTYFFSAVAIAWLAAGCNEPAEPETEQKPETKDVTIDVRPDGWTVRMEPITPSDSGSTEDARVVNLLGDTRSLTADGKAMTDIWILDYQNGSLLQQVHQSDNTADDFGRPTLTLTYGQHHLYVVASRGGSPELNTTSHTIQWAKIFDTFWTDRLLNVSATTDGSQSIILDRVVTKLTLAFTDVIPAGAATINITPHLWYFGIDYLTGEPAAAAIDRTITMNIPANEIGNTISANMFSFSDTAEWSTSVEMNSKDGDDHIIGHATIPSAPFRRNRVSIYTGPLFSAGGVMTLSLNTDWLDDYTGSW